MAIEIERKFLVRDDSWRPHASTAAYYRQGYLVTSRRCSVRVRVAGDDGFLNIKGATLGASRAEYEYPIPVQDAEEMLERLCTRPLIEKTRYFVRSGRHTWEVDVFEGENTGLVLAEIELRHAHEEFERPAWLGEEVTDDRRYYNARLVEHPYREWGGV